jgi:putative transposase
MRHKQFTLKASSVHAHARRLLLEELDLRNYRPKLPAGLVVSLLILASVWQSSLSGACRLVKDPPCREAARRAAFALLPRKPRELIEALRRALRNTVPDHLRRVPLVMALDLHQRPYYGRKNTRGCTRRQNKQGTRGSFTYATIAALTRWGRFSVGLLLVRPKMRLTTIVGELLAQAEEAGLACCRLLLDKEFYAAEVVGLLQKRGAPFIMPAEDRGASKFLYDPKTAPGFYPYGWEGDLRRYDPEKKKRVKRGKLAVRVLGCCARHNKTGKPLGYATWGLAGWSPRQVSEEYRRRFGIEASYRQLNGCLARTSSTSERYRLLLVGVALLLCNLW